MKKTIGIIGGMGPLATCDLFGKIIENTDAKSDQEHIRIFIDNNTNISDRTAAILHGGESPLTEMVKSATKLKAMGADVLIMPCNTAHYFLPEIKKQVEIPFINMLEETAKEIKKRGMKKVGLLATSGTIQSGIYKKVFDTYGIDMLIPDAEGQKHVMSIIYDGIKKGDLSIDTAGFRKTIDKLFAEGAEAMVLGCTELPPAFKLFEIDRPNIDPTLVLARVAIEFAGAKLK